MSDGYSYFCGAHYLTDVDGIDLGDGFYSRSVGPIEEVK